jgi:hypothetical protein
LVEKIPSKAQDKCVAYLDQLERIGTNFGARLLIFLEKVFMNCGHPTRESIIILYFFSGKNMVVISHGLKKEGGIPAVEIRRAIERKRKFEADPKAHTFRR